MVQPACVMPRVAKHVLAVFRLVRDVAGRYDRGSDERCGTPRKDACLNRRDRPAASTAASSTASTAATGWETVLRGRTAAARCHHALQGSLRQGPVLAIGRELLGPFGVLLRLKRDHLADARLRAPVGLQVRHERTRRRDKRLRRLRWTRSAAATSLRNVVEDRVVDVLHLPREPLCAESIALRGAGRAVD